MKTEIVNTPEKIEDIFKRISELHEDLTQSQIARLPALKDLALRGLATIPRPIDPSMERILAWFKPKTIGFESTIILHRHLNGWLEEFGAEADLNNFEPLVIDMSALETP